MPINHSFRSSFYYYSTQFHVTMFNVAFCSYRVTAWDANEDAKDQALADLDVEKQLCERPAFDAVLVPFPIHIVPMCIPFVFC
jgi:hypothetical protein